MLKNDDALRALLVAVQRGETTPDAALDALRTLPFQPLDGSLFDTHRALRTGLAEVIYAPGKRLEDLDRLIAVSLREHAAVLVSRVEPAVAEPLCERFPTLTYHRRARLLAERRVPAAPAGHVAVLAAGTADGPVADEAALTLQHFGTSVRRIDDVGVAGLHRLLHHVDALREAHALVVVAGMEGALPSVVAGLVGKPVIAVPTSVGYGAAFGGIAALLAMLNSCAAGVAVVNIDNGFGAACVAHFIARQAAAAGPAETP